MSNNGLSKELNELADSFKMKLEDILDFLSVASERKLLIATVPHGEKDVLISMVESVSANEQIIQFNIDDALERINDSEIE